MKPNRDLGFQVREQAAKIETVNRTMKNLDQRLAYIDVKLEDACQRLGHLEKLTGNGNLTRNFIGACVGIRVLFDGWHAVNWTWLSHALKLFGG